MAAKSSPGGFVVATVTNPGSFMATITHPTGNGYCRDRILRDSFSSAMVFGSKMRTLVVFQVQILLVCSQTQPSPIIICEYPTHFNEWVACGLLLSLEN